MWDDSLFYDREGNPIAVGEWVKLREDVSYIIVKKTVVGSAEVSTVWLGINHAVVGPPLIFETMIFSTETSESPFFPGKQYRAADDFMARYSSEEDALRGHEEVVEAITLREEQKGQVE